MLPFLNITGKVLYSVHSFKKPKSFGKTPRHNTISEKFVRSLINKFINNCL